MTIITAYYYSPLIGMKNSKDANFNVINSEKINNYLKRIPQHASVSATNEMGAHLSHRERIYVLPYGETLAEYLVIYNNSDMHDLVDLSLYEEFVSDSKLNFYIYKKRGNLKCLTCKP